jgi:His/Glu/Gln/Arg/opine family amino acid ABC transporter permease subunit
MDRLIEYSPLLARGALVTIALALVSLALATALGGVAAAARIGGGRLGRNVVLAYTSIVRGVPDLVMILLVYFGGQRLLNAVVGLFGFETASLSPFWAGALAIGFIYGAYLAETFRGAYMTIPRGQLEAGQALGMRGLPLIGRVMIPQLIRFALPGYGNVWQVLVKSTAVVSVIGLEDLVGLANDAGKTAREPFLFLSAVMLVYLAITFVSTNALALMERRYALKGHHAR